MESRTPKEWFDYYATLRDDELDEMARARNVDLSGRPLHTIGWRQGYGKPHLVTRLSQSRGYTPSKNELEKMLWADQRRKRDERARASCERRWLQAAEEAKAAGAWVQDAPSSATPELFDGAWVTAGPTKRKQGRQVRDLDRTRERELLFVDALAQELNAARVVDGEEATVPDSAAPVQAAIAAALAEDDAPASPQVRRPDATQGPEALVGPPSSVGGLLEGLMNAPGGAAALAHALQARQNAQRTARDDIHDSDNEDRDVARRLQGARDQERRERETVPTIGGSWVCTTCTFENPNPNALVCEICNTIRLRPVSVEDAAALESARAAAAPRPSAPVPPPAPRPAPTVAAPPPVPPPAPAATQAARPEPPDVLLCPIGMDLMRDPVLAMDGHTYERSEIERWLADHQTSPKTNAPLPSKMLVPNHSVKSMVQEYLDAAKKRG